MNTSMQTKVIKGMNNLTEEQKAIVRTVANVAICVVDLYPGVGLAIPALANVAKFARKYDLTPSFPKTLAFGFLVFDLPTLGIFPAYWLQTAVQLRNDYPLLKKAYREWKGRKQLKDK